MTVYIGIDPDTHHAGVAVVADWQREPIFLGVAAIDQKKYKGEEATSRIGYALKEIALKIEVSNGVRFTLDTKVLIVESQQQLVYGHARKKDILMLAQSAGVAVGVFQSLISGIQSTTIVQPYEWKGQIDKELHHSNTIIPHLRWRTNHGMEEWGIKKSHEQHVLDALGLALWGMVRAQLPRDPNRAEEAPLRGLVLTRERLLRLESRLEQAGPQHH